MTLSLLLVLAGAPVQFCVGEVCAPAVASLPAGAVGPLVAVDAVGNTEAWGLVCSWRGVLVTAVVELTPAACFEARARLDDAVDALTRAGLVHRDEWPRVIASALRAVVLYPARTLDVPRGEQFVEGVYVPDTVSMHLTATLEAAPHELFHAVLQARGGGVGHDKFSKLVDFIHGAFAAKHRRSPVL